MTKFASKHEAAKCCKQILGHTVHYDTGASGGGADLVDPVFFGTRRAGARA